MTNRQPSLQPRRMRFADRVAEYALQVIARSLQALSEAAEPLPPAVVRRLRVDIKRLRSVWHLMRGDTDPALRKDSVARLRTIHKSLAPARDRQMILKTLGKLARKAAEPATVAALEQLAGEVDAAAPGAPDAGAVAAGLQLEADRWRQLATRDRPDSKLIDRGYRRALRSGRKLARRFLAGGPETLLHRWRKFAKHSFYQLEILKPALSEGNRARRKLLKRLADSLGVHQDLYMVEATLAASALEPSARARVSELVGQRKARMETRAMELYDVLYGAGLSAIVEEVAADVARLGASDRRAD